MTGPQRLCVVHLPSSQELAWRRALTNAAIAQGGSSWDYVSGQEIYADPHVNAIIHCSDARDVATLDPTAAVILCSLPSDATRVLMSRFDIDELSAIRSVARVSAFASDLAARGIAVINAHDEWAEFPVFGKVVREADTLEASVSSKLGNPLAIYDALPPPVGAQAIWVPALLQWVGSEQPGVADLTGRRRLLQHGPYLELSSGNWTIEAKFAVSLNRAKADLRFEWGTGTDAQTWSYTFTESGRYAVALTKEWLEPAVCELRIWLDGAMFDGDLVMEDYVVTRAN